MTQHVKRMIAFVLMPFGSESDNKYQNVIRPACESVGLDCRRAEELVFHGGILQEIYSQISNADIIIADLSQSNINVWYELGYAHALGKQTILIAPAPERLPFDMGSSYVITGLLDSIRIKDELTKFLWSYVNPVRARQIENEAEYGVQTENIAIVFGDLVGSTLIMRSLGELDFSEFLPNYLARIASLAKEHGGRYIKSMGDGFLAIFTTAENALSFAKSISQFQLETKRVGAPLLLTRIGIHFGKAGIRRSQYGEDIMGDGVILAARLAGVAGAGEIFMSEDAALSLPFRTFQQLDSRGEVSLKGFKKAPRVFALHPEAGGSSHE